MGKKIKKSKGFSGNDKVYDISCGKCGHYVFTYLKLGKGGILRCYLSRILEPPSPGKITIRQSRHQTRRPAQSGVF
jgi:hypothetical protein